MVIFLVGAIYIVDHPLFFVAQSQLFSGPVRDVGDVADVGLKEGVEEMDEVVFVRLGAEKPLETEVGQQVIMG